MLLITLFSALNQNYAALSAFQHQMISPWYSTIIPPWYSTMIQQQTQQAQMGALQPQVHFPQQQIHNVVSSSILITSTTSPAFTSFNIVSTTSQSLCHTSSVTSQPITVHTTMTTVQQQKLHCNSSTNITSSSSQVCKLTCIMVSPKFILVGNNNDTQRSIRSIF